VLVEKGIVEYAMMKDCSKDFFLLVRYRTHLCIFVPDLLYAVFEYTSISPFFLKNRTSIALTMKSSIKVIFKNIQ
jgi:hypothetical protein